MSDLRTDQELLCLWDESRDQAAFAELVARHSPLVYSAAMRQTRDPQLAQDISQAVFVLLCRKAHSLRRHAMISGWLYQTTRLTSLAALRMKTRRQKAEERAGITSAMNQAEEESLWQQMSPLLDAAMATLSDSDRQLVLSRYFENRSHAQTAKMLGIAENAAARRFSRAIEKLRDHFRSKGVIVPAAAIGTVLGKHAIEAVPAHVAAAIGGAVSAGTTALANSTMWIMTVAKLKTAAALLLGCALIGGAAVISAQTSARPTTAPTTQAAATSQPTPVAPVTVPVVETVSVVTAHSLENIKSLQQFSLMVNEAMADDLRRAGTPVKTESKLFEAFELSDADLYRIVAAGWNTAAVSRNSSNRMITSKCTPGSTAAMAGEVNSLTAATPALNGRTVAYSSIQSTLKLKDDGDGMNVDLGTNYKYITASPPANRGASNRIPADLRFTGHLGIGRSVVFLLPMMKTEQGGLVNLIAIDAIELPAEYQNFADLLHDLDLWVTLGRTGLRPLFDEGVAWEKRISKPDELALAKYETVLDDGTMFRISQISVPKKHPFQCWDATGRPMTIKQVPMPSDTDGPVALVQGFRPEKDNPSGVLVESIPVKISVGVSFYCTTEKGTYIGDIEDGQPLKKGDRTFSVKNVKYQKDVAGQQFATVTFSFSGGKDFYANPVMVDQNGTEHLAENDSIIRLTDTWPPPNRKPGQAQGLVIRRTENMDHIGIRVWDYKHIVFENVAEKPDMSLAAKSEPANAK